MKILKLPSMLIALLWTFVSVAETTVYTCPKILNLKTESIKATNGSAAGFKNYGFRLYLPKSGGADSFDKYFGNCYYEAYHSAKYPKNNWAPFYSYTHPNPSVTCSTGTGSEKGKISCSDGTQRICPGGLNLVGAVPNNPPLNRTWRFDGMLKDANCFKSKGKTKCNCNYWAMEIVYTTKSDRNQTCTTNDNVITCVK